MAQWDNETGKLNPTWTVRFSPWIVLLGCAIAGVVCALVLLATAITGQGLENIRDGASVVQGALIILAISFTVFIVLGPTLAWGLGFAIRNITNQSVHVLAFAILGVLVGFMLGNFIGLGEFVAPAAGIGAGAGRWAISRFAKD